MYDEWVQQDFTSLAGEVPHDTGDIGVPQTDGLMSADQIFARVADADLDTRQVVGVDPDLRFIVWDGFLDLGAKGSILSSLAGDDDLPDGGTVDDIVVSGDVPDGTPELPSDGRGDQTGNSGTSGGGSGSQSPTQQPPADPYDACQDRESDALAEDINDEISRQPDSDKREYGP